MCPCYLSYSGPYQESMGRHWSGVPETARFTGGFTTCAWAGACLPVRCDIVPQKVRFSVNFDADAMPLIDWLGPFGARV